MNSSADSRLMFISHRHADEGIASVLTRFAKRYSGGRVEVFQSSTATASFPRSGKSLNQELMNSLFRTDVLILIYTTVDHDWSYCMWECGVATDPQSPDTRVILFQCSDSCPPLFADQVRVNVRRRIEVEKFVAEFLTHKDFFRGRDEAIAPGFEEHGTEVIEAADQLFKELQQVIPAIEQDAEEEWPALPFIQFRISCDIADQLRAFSQAGDMEAGRHLVRRSAQIASSDKCASNLFGMAGFPRGYTLLQLGETCHRKYPTSECHWVDGLCEQLIDACNWEFPRPRYDALRFPGDNTIYIPTVTRVRKIPAEKSFQCDVYFYKLPSTFETTPTGSVLAMAS